MSTPRPPTDADRVADDAALLSGAATVAFGGVGFTGAVLPETAAYRALLDAGPAARPHADWLLAHAGPAGRVYAAHLVARWDADAGRRAWESLAAQGDEVQTMAGCLASSTTLADYAARQLGSLSPPGP